MKRYTLVIEPLVPAARRELVVEVRDDGDACDQAADHEAAELPYGRTIAIAKIAERPTDRLQLAAPAETNADRLSSRFLGSDWRPG